MRKSLTSLFGAVTATAILAGCSQSNAGGVTVSTVSVTVSQTVTATVTETVTADAPEPSLPDEPSDAESTTATLPVAVDPCQLLTQAEATTLAGIELQPAVSAGAEGIPTLCQYTADPNGPVAQVQILTGDGVEKSLQIDRDVLFHEFTTVDGLGDEAFQEDNNIFVHKGANWAQINLVLLNDPADNVAPMQQAAQLMASRMP